MATVTNLPISLTVSLGDALPVFIMNEGILMRISLNTLATLIGSTVFADLPKQTNPTIAPVATGFAYINTDGYVVIAQ